MGKIKLGSTPKTLKRTVVVKLPDGSEGRIEAEYRYRTRRQFGELLQRLSDDGKAPDETPNIAALLARGVEANAAYLEEILVGWDLDEKMTRAALEQLADELPAVALALMNEYRAAIIEGHAGN